MTELQITELRYALVTDKTADYDMAPPINAETDDFKISINQGLAIFRLKRHFPTIEDAKAVAEDFLKRWEVLIGIEHTPDEVRFVFDSALSSSSEKNHIGIIIGDEGKGHDDVITHRSYTEYPTLPTNFLLSPDVETMYLRYKGYRHNREPLTSMAYMCLTILEVSAGDRKEAKKLKRVSRKYRISCDVLKRLGNLCTNKGDAKEARKAQDTFTPLTGEEKVWIETVIKAIILRVGEWACNPDADFKELTLADFPDLKP